MEELQIKVKLTEKDYRRFCFSSVFNWRRNALLFFAVFMASFLEFKDSFSVGVAICISLAIASAVIAFCYACCFLFAKRIFKQSMVGQYETTYTFAKEDMTVENENSNSTNSYDVIVRLGKTKTILAIYNSKITAMIIPINDGNRDTVEKIYAFLREKCPNTKKIF